MSKEVSDENFIEKKIERVIAPAMFEDKKIPKHKCPRCKSARVSKRLDGSSWCARCGQRVSNDGRLVPSADRRQNPPKTDNQMNLL